MRKRQVKRTLSHREALEMTLAFHRGEMTASAMARRYGVHPQTVSRIVYGAARREVYLDAEQILRAEDLHKGDPSGEGAA